jgi:hypothetical protein
MRVSDWGILPGYRRRFRNWLLIVLAVAAAMASGTAWAAKPIIVCSSGCAYTTIQDAINAAPDRATITIAPGTYGGFSVPGTNSGLTNVTLVGAGAGETTVSGVHVVINSGESATIRGVTVTRASAPLVGDDAHLGGGIFNSGTLTLKDSTVSSNGGGAFGGGGILNGGTLTLKDSTVSNNGSGRTGGGILNWGTATLTDSTVSGNGARLGGGIYNTGTLTLKDSTISGNGGRQGSGILNSGTLTLNKSTVSGNSGADYGGGGIFNYGTLTLNHSEISGNTAYAPGGGIDEDPLAMVTLNHSTVSGNTPDNCFPPGAVTGCMG